MISRGTGKADQVRVSLDALCADPARARALPAQVGTVGVLRARVLRDTPRPDTGSSPA